MGMTRTFGDLLAVAADIYRVDPKRMTAFQGRIKHFVRLGFPKSAHSGKGITHRYTAREQRQLFMVLEITRMGFPPQAAIDMARSNYQQLLEAIHTGGKVEIVPKCAFGDGPSGSTITVDMTPYGALGIDHLPEGDAR